MQVRYTSKVGNTSGFAGLVVEKNPFGNFLLGQSRHRITMEDIHSKWGSRGDAQGYLSKRMEEMHKDISLLKRVVDDEQQQIYDVHKLLDDVKRQLEPFKSIDWNALTIMINSTTRRLEGGDGMELK